MSINQLELAYWRAYVVPTDSARMKADTAAYLRDFDLEPKERAMAEAWKAKDLILHGVNPLLMMMAWQTIKGFETLQDYFGIVNAPD